MAKRRGVKAVFPEGRSGKMGPTISTMVRAHPGHIVDGRPTRVTGEAFMACARVGKTYEGGRGTACANGRNPRAAIKNAVAKLMNGRSGAFAGYRKGRK